MNNRYLLSTHIDTVGRYLQPVVDNTGVSLSIMINNIPNNITFESWKYISKCGNEEIAEYFRLIVIRPWLPFTKMTFILRMKPVGQQNIESGGRHHSIDMKRFTSMERFLATTKTKSSHLDGFVLLSNTCSNLLQIRK